MMHEMMESYVIETGIPFVMKARRHPNSAIPAPARLLAALTTETISMLAKISVTAAF
jgi:hypothetical protein